MLAVRSILKKQYWFFSLLVMLLLTPLASVAKQYFSVEEFVSDQKVIQILIDSTPGYGNQSASMNAMSRLRQLGFSRVFEIVYNDIDSAVVKDKVSILFGLPSDFSDDYTVIHPLFGEIHLISLSKQLAKLKDGIEKVTLSIDGGDEFTNYAYEAKNYNAVMSLSIGPYIQYPSRIKHEQWDEDRVLPAAKNKFYVVSVSSLNDAKNFLLHDANGIALSQKKPALNTLIDGVEKQDFYLLPMYGYTLQARKDSDGEYHAEQLHHVLRIIAGVRYAQQKSKALQEKPIIIGVFYDYTREMQFLNTFLQSNHWGEYERLGSATARKVLNALDVKSVLQFASISDADASDRIKALKPGQLLMLSLEPLPKPVFDGLYNHTGSNMLPAIREGANTFNTLVLTGKPHFRCGDTWRNAWEIGYDYLMTDSQFQTQFQTLTDNLCLPDQDTRPEIDGPAESVWLTHETLYRQLGDFILDARNPESALSQYFSNLQAAALKPENDRIRYVLSEALQVLQGNKTEIKH